MFKIVKKEKVAENTYQIDVEAPDLASHAKPGQFLIVMPRDQGERVPLTIADSTDKIVSIIFIVAGKSTSELVEFNEGDSIPHVVGPLGNPSEIQDEDFVCLVGGGVGIAAIYPIAKEYANQGKKVHAILGVRNEKFLFWKEKFEEFCDKVIVASDDGSIGDKGNVVEVLDKYYPENKYELVIAIGPTIMMKFVAKYTKEKGIKTIVSLNTLMVDGIGMCGGCRINYDGKIKFVCVEGPEFDASKVDFDEIMNRNASYKEEEGHSCRLNKVSLPER